MKDYWFIVAHLIALPNNVLREAELKDRGFRGFRNEQ